MRQLYFAFFAILFLPSGLQAQTVGLFTYEDEAFEGYTLFAPLRSNNIYLIDNCGKEVHRWETDANPAQMVYLLEDGTLLRTARTGLVNPVINAGGAGERFQKLDWEGNLLWDFVYSDNNVRMHHDIEPLPNGNVLVLAWEYKSVDEAVAQGRDPNFLDDNALWPEHIIEVQQTGPTSGEIVWAWHLWDHLIQDQDPNKPNYGVVAEHPELLDINFYPDFPTPGDADWIHANCLDYNPELDQIIFGSPGLNELYVIDHSTTTEEAAGHTGGNSGKGGDILYRWGNPIGYDQGTLSDRQLFGQHDVRWIDAGLPDAGKIMLFNNGRDRPGGNASSVDIISPPVDAEGNYAYTPNTAYGPAAPDYTFQYPNPTDWYSSFISGAEQQPNGNILICSGAEGRFFEINAEDNIVWEYVNPVTVQGPTPQGEPIPPNGSLAGNIVFRSTRYTPDYPGLQNLDLSPGSPIEPNPLPNSADCNTLTSTDFLAPSDWRLYPNPAADHIQVELPARYARYYRLVDWGGRLVRQGQLPENGILDVSNLPNGVYVLDFPGSTPQRLVIGR